MGVHISALGAIRWGSGIGYRSPTLLCFWPGILGVTAPEKSGSSRPFHLVSFVTND